MDERNCGFCMTNLKPSGLVGFDPKTVGTSIPFHLKKKKFYDLEQSIQEIMSYL